MFSLAAFNKMEEIEDFQVASIRVRVLQKMKVMVWLILLYRMLTQKQDYLQ